MPYFIKGRSIDFYFLEKEFSRQAFFLGHPRLPKNTYVVFMLLCVFWGVRML